MRNLTNLALCLLMVGCTLPDEVSDFLDEPDAAWVSCGPELQAPLTRGVPVQVDPTLRRAVGPCASSLRASAEVEVSVETEGLVLIEASPELRISIHGLGCEDPSPCGDVRAFRLRPGEPQVIQIGALDRGPGEEVQVLMTLE